MDGEVSPTQQGTEGELFITHMEAAFSTQPSTAVSDNRCGLDTAGSAFLSTAEVSMMDCPLPMRSVDEGEESEGEQSAASERSRHLLQEAAIRAEHQARAREMLLELAQVVEELRASKRRRTAALQEERGRSARLEATVARLKEELAQALLAEEKTEAERLRKLMISRSNRFVLSMMLEKSRQAYQSEVFDAPANNTVEPVMASFEGSTMRQPDGDDESQPSHPPRPNSLADLVMGRVSTTPNLGSLTEGDRVFFGWVLKRWSVQCEETRMRNKEAEEARKRQALEDERKRKEAEMIRNAKRPLEGKIYDLEEKLALAHQTIAEQQEIIDNSEGALERALADYAERERRRQAEEETMRAELARVRCRLSESEATASKYLQELQEAKHMLANKDKIAQDEIDRLKGQLKIVTGELDQAVILARHMRETALKAKRDMALSVSPEKFSQLVGLLEETKDRMSLMGRELDGHREESASLKSKLMRNQRRLELERQFLPLLHRASGPLGPKSRGGGKVAENAARPTQALLAGAELAPPGTEQGLRESRSAGSLRNGAAPPRASGPLSGPLMGSL